MPSGVWFRTGRAFAFCELGFVLEDCGLRHEAALWGSVGQKFTVEAEANLASPLRFHPRGGGHIYYLKLICQRG